MLITEACSDCYGAGKVDNGTSSALCNNCFGTGKIHRFTENPYKEVLDWFTENIDINKRGLDCLRIERLIPEKGIKFKFSADIWLDADDIEVAQGNTVFEALTNLKAKLEKKFK